MVFTCAAAVELHVIACAHHGCCGDAYAGCLHQMALRDGCTTNIWQLALLLAASTCTLCAVWCRMQGQRHQSLPTHVMNGLDAQLLVIKGGQSAPDQSQSYVQVPHKSPQHTDNLCYKPALRAVTAYSTSVMATMSVCSIHIARPIREKANPTHSTNQGHKHPQPLGSAHMPTLRAVTAYSMHDMTFMSLCSTWLPTLRCTKISPGARPRIWFACGVSARCAQHGDSLFTGIHMTKLVTSD